MTRMLAVLALGMPMMAMSQVATPDATPATPSKMAPQTPAALPPPASYPVQPSQAPAPLPPPPAAPVVIKTTAKSDETVPGLKIISALKSINSDRSQANMIMQSAQQQASVLAADADANEARLEDQVEAVKKLEGWGDDVHWDPQRSVFVRIAVPAVTVAAPAAKSGVPASQPVKPVK
jgi:hypothetical protein